MSREAAKWAWALRSRGWQVTTVAGEGPVDRLVPGLAMDATGQVSVDEVRAALADADVVVVENLCSLPLNPRAAEVVAAVLRGRPAVLRHHDLPWQRDRFAGWPGPPDDPAWAHVTINRLSEGQLADRGVRAVTMYNAFDTDASDSDVLPHLRPFSDRLLVLHPTRAIPRKNVPAALRLAEGLGAVYWLTGPAEEGYGTELASLLAAAAVPVVRDAVDDMAAAYRLADVVAFPSTNEGFGNPVIESAVYRRPLAVTWYPVLDELRAFGFRWLDVDDVDGVRTFLRSPDQAMLEANFAIADRHFSLRALPDRLAALFEAQGWAV